MEESPPPKSLNDFGNLLTEAETGEVLRVSRQTLYRMRRDGRLAAVKVRGALRYRKTDLMRLLRGDED